MPSEIKEHDIVHLTIFNERLKMAVLKLNKSTNEAECFWFSTENNFEKATFPLSILAKFETHVPKDIGISQPQKKGTKNSY